MKPKTDISSRDDLILEYQVYVRSLVGQMIQAMGLPTSHFDEFVASGFLGLVEAAERYRPDSGVEFRNFAYLRIRGAVIDSIRACSDLSGRAYHNARALKAANELRSSEIEEIRPTSSENSSKRGLANILEYSSRVALAYRLNLEHSDTQPNEEERGVTPEAILEKQQESLQLKKLLSRLPEKERLIIQEHYFNDKSFIEISREHPTLSKSWISRLHSRALTLLKEAYVESQAIA